MSGDDIRHQVLLETTALLNRGYSPEELRTLVFEAGYDPSQVTSKYEAKSAAVMDVTTFFNRRVGLAPLLSVMARRSDMNSRANALLAKLAIAPVEAMPEPEPAVETDDLAQIASELEALAARLRRLVK